MLPAPLPLPASSFPPPAGLLPALPLFHALPTPCPATPPLFFLPQPGLSLLSPPPLSPYLVDPCFLLSALPSPCLTAPPPSPTACLPGCFLPSHPAWLLPASLPQLGCFILSSPCWAASCSSPPRALSSPWLLLLLPALPLPS